MPHVLRPAGAIAERNRMTPERAMRAAQLVVDWPENVRLPKRKADRDLVNHIFTSGLSSRPRDEWVDIDLLELARYSKLMVQLARMQDSMESLKVGTPVYRETLAAVTKMSGLVHTIARKLYLHKIIANINSAAYQASVARAAQKVVDTAPEPAPGRSRPQLIA